jgi:uncharacterized membrane protein YcaP (DUF421 family)
MFQVFQGLYYYWYALFGLLLQGRNKQRELTAFHNLIVASLAGCMTALLTNPYLFLFSLLTLPNTHTHTHSLSLSLHLSEEICVV